MRRVLKGVLIAFLVLNLNMAMANEGAKYASKYGLPVEFNVNSSYPGDIEIEGVYIHKNDWEYVLTVTYCNGELKELLLGGESVVKSSFFNPPEGDIVSISWIKGYEQISSGDGFVQYRVDKDQFESISFITIFLYDVLVNDDMEENISVYFPTDSIDYDQVPSEEDLIAGYDITTIPVETEFESEPSEWAHKGIEELKLEGLLRNDAFTDFNKGISRQDFIYLMVTLYEQLSGNQAKIDPSIQFDDTDDQYVNKAAALGITNGIGNNLFGPDLVLDREQMTTFMIKTLKLSGVDLAGDETVVEYSDDEEVSGWAKDSVYAARRHGIMGGMGNNTFSPKSSALNEQALSVMHKLLVNYGSLNWLKQYDKDRLYLRYGDEYYKIALNDHMIINENLDSSSLYFSDFEDINTMLNVLLVNEENLKYDDSRNPNVKGKLLVHDHKKMNVTTSNLYLGVDKIGETTKITFGDDAYKPEVINRFDMDTVVYKYFEKVKFYDLAGERQIVKTFSFKKIADIFDLDYRVFYHSSWNIYVIEVTGQTD